MVKVKSSQIYECGVCQKEYNNKGDAERCELRDKKRQKEEAIERTKDFTITKDHLKLLKRMNVDWDNCEFGAPYIDPKRPYGNSDVIDDMAEILGIKKGRSTIDFDIDELDNYDSPEDYYEEAEWNDKTYDKLNTLHKEMQIVLQIILVTGEIKEGRYVKKDEYGYDSWCSFENEGVKK